MLKILLNKYPENKLFILIDQALYSLFNFGSIFLLSKLANVSVFSSYVIFLSYINIVFIFSTFLLSSPILVLLSKKRKEEHSPYLSSLLFSNLFITIVLASICYLFMTYQGISIPYLYIILPPMLMSFFDIFKKYMFSSLRIALRHAACSSMILNSIFFISIFYFRAELTLINIIFLFSLSFFSGSLYLLIVLFFKKIIRPPFSKQTSYNWQAYTSTFKQHYAYSKWIILGGVAYWGYSQGLFILSKSFGVSDLGISKVRTAQNLLGILSVFIVSVDNYYIPYFSKYIKDYPKEGLHSIVVETYIKHYKKIVLLIGCSFLFSWIAYQLLYKNKYGAGLELILVFTGIQMVLFFIRPITIALKAKEITYPFFSAHIVALLTMLIFGYFTIQQFGYQAMPYTFLIAYCFFSFVLVYFYYKKVYKC